METKRQSTFKQEQIHLKNTVTMIHQNVERLSAEVARMKEDTKEMYDNYRSGDSELHNDLVIGLDLQNLAEHTLYRNLMAEEKAYFGRIDYEEQQHDGMLLREEEEHHFSLYIGKNGIMQSGSEILIVDWRAPVATVYYDSDIGTSHYLSPDGDTIRIDLQLKRTFELKETHLEDFYDTDVITNDEFLTKYLAQNKEVVLGEIIATIQKEQNVIIRDNPWHTVIVQGVAGSGKTTVAMHRISYILYNYKDKFKPQEFYVIGSNKMLLNYITGVLPSLDVQGINQMTMEEMMLKFLEKEISRFQIQNSFLRLNGGMAPLLDRQLLHFKGSLDFSLSLEYYLNEKERMDLPEIPEDGIVYRGRVLYTKEQILQFLQDFSTFQQKDGSWKKGGVSAEEKKGMLNTRIINKVKTICEMNGEEREVITREGKKFKDFFGKAKKHFQVKNLYQEFLHNLVQRRDRYLQLGLTIPEEAVLQQMQIEFTKKQIDIYDLSQLLLIRKRMCEADPYEHVAHVVVDEAQDFGVSVFYSLHQVFPEATFTIMGDVSQNIYYDAGMNDWVELRERIFNHDKDCFYRLVKSYRNTVEISEFAGHILEKGHFETYAIEPVIRHGKPVTFLNSKGEKELIADTIRTIQGMEQEGLHTIAVICRTKQKCHEAAKALEREMKVLEITEDMEDISLATGVCVLPIHMTKGLEFDGVLLWDPVDEDYPVTDANVKLLYVAVTRALHQLVICNEQEQTLSGLLKPSFS